MVNGEFVIFRFRYRAWEHILSNTEYTALWCCLSNFIFQQFGNYFNFKWFYDSLIYKDRPNY